MSDYESKPPSVGLWKNDKENGPVCSGISGNIRFVVWRNDKRGNDKAPDFRLVMEGYKTRDTVGGKQAESTPLDRYTDASKGGAMPDDEIPF